MTRRARTLPNLCLAGLLAFPLVLPAEAQTLKPQLSDEVKRLIDEKGSQAAMVDVVLLVTRLAEFDVSRDRLVALANAYTSAGDPDAALVVVQLAQSSGGQMTADLQVVQGDAYAAKGLPQLAESLYLEALQDEPEHPRARAQLVAVGGTLPDAAPEPTMFSTGGEPSRADVMRWQNVGAPRDDVDRFTGMYLSANGANRYVAVYETCLGSGHLASAPMWAGVAPWILESESDLAFHEARAPQEREPVQLRFEDPAAGQADAVIFTGGLEDRFERAGSLEAGFQPEGDQCYRPF